MYWIIREPNVVVTKHSFDIISRSASKVCNDVVNIDNLSSLKGDRSSDVIVVGTIINAIQVFIRGYKNVIVWFQGIAPEESYMKKNKHIRSKIL